MLATEDYTREISGALELATNQRADPSDPTRPAEARRSSGCRARCAPGEREDADVALEISLARGRARVRESVEPLHELRPHPGPRI